MDRFTKLFGPLLLFVYHCFDRIVIHGYLSGLSRPEQVVYFFRQVVGQPVVDKATLSQRTSDYQNWVEAYARIELPWKAITHFWNPLCRWRRVHGVETDGKNGKHSGLMIVPGTPWRL